MPRARNREGGLNIFQAAQEQMKQEVAEKENESGQELDSERNEEQGWAPPKLRSAGGEDNSERNDSEGGEEGGQSGQGSTASTDTSGTKRRRRR